MTDYDYDLLVIGAGSGGVRASRFASQRGARVGIIEERYLGGTCVNVGCVPKKLFSYGAHFSEEFEAAQGYGWQLDTPNFDWKTLRDNKEKEIQRLNLIYADVLKNANVSLLEGKGVITGPHTVQVNDETYTAERILIAVGGWPKIPNIEGREHITDSNQVFYIDTFPEKAVVVGGGYIGVEFASIFNGLGVDTHLLYRGDLFLKGFDRDVREFTANEMTKKGVNLHFSSNIKRIKKLSDGKLQLDCDDGSQLTTDMVLYATGRHPKIDGLGLENTKVQCAENQAIKVNDQFQTDEPSIYAIGDVIDRVQLTPVALSEGMMFAKNTYGNESVSLSYNNIPTAVFCHPSIATVGLTEEQASEQYESIALYTTNFRSLKHTISGVDERVYMKLIVDVKSDRVLGCHMVGDQAGEIMQGFAVALNAGATKAQFDATIGIHPTMAEDFVTMREPTKVIENKV